ncbi:MAG: hypothetical protein MMC23_008299 [Stictis urceolatum]|nr:hypothetical protein [Stictis urceolata]
MHSSRLLALLPLLRLTLSTPSSGCGSALPPAFTPGVSGNSLTLPGLDREYILHIPSSYDEDTAHPLYLSFHGASKTDSEQESLCNFDDPTLNPHGISVYPQGKNDYWLSNPSASLSRPNDLDFVSALVDHMQEKLCIDTAQIYAAGKSNGGGFVDVLACNATVGSRFAAFASVSGAYYDTDSTAGIGPCAPAERALGTPFLEFHGTNDSTAPYYGGPTLGTNGTPKLPTLDIVRAWAVRNGCAEGEAPASNETVFTGDLVKKAVWNCGGNEGVVQHYMEHEWGHCWTSTVLNDDIESHADCSLGKYVFNATNVIFDFFGQHKLEG